MRFQFQNPFHMLTSFGAGWSVARGAISLTVTALAISACGGGGTTSDQPNGAIAAASASGIRPLPDNFTSRKAVAYSPYRTANRDTETVTDALVKQDLDLLVQAGIGAIRIFDSSEKVAFRTLRLIRAHKMDIKVMQGIYLNSYEYEENATKRAAVLAFNEDEMARGVALANSYPDIISAVSVGNETMVSWSIVAISSPTMASYIKRVRDQIQQPVTTDDNWAFYAGQGRNAAEQANDVLRQIDFAAVHTYSHEDAFYSNPADTDLNPDWDWQQLAVTDLTKRAAAMMDAAIGKTKKDYASVRSFLDKSGRAALPIVIGETGWKAADPSGSGRYKFLASPVNQLMYYRRLLDWVAETRNSGGPKGVFYFEAFDEPWKSSDDKWGLFNVQRQARCSAQYLKPTATWVKESGTCDEATAVYFKPPTLNAAITQSTYVIHNETTTGWPSGLRADAYETGTFALDYPAKGDSAPSDQAATIAASSYLALRNFTPKDYGWGVLWQSAGTPPVTANLSAFAGGSIRFSIKTAYAGSLRIGISSDTELGNPVEANVIVGAGKYGYCTAATASAATWCDVNIPLSAFTAANPKLDLRYVLTRFSVADIYSETGNTARTGMPTIALDNIYWQK